MGMFDHNGISVVAFAFNGERLWALLADILYQPAVKETIVIHRLKKYGVHININVEPLDTKESKFEKVLADVVEKTVCPGAVVNFGNGIYAYYMGKYPAVQAKNLADNIVYKTLDKLTGNFADSHFYHVSMEVVEFLSKSKRNLRLQTLFKNVVEPYIAMKVKEISILHEKLHKLKNRYQSLKDDLRDYCREYEALKVIVLGQPVDSIRKYLKKKYKYKYWAPMWDSLLNQVLRGINEIRFSLVMKAEPEYYYGVVSDLDWKIRTTKDRLDKVRKEIKTINEKIKKKEWTTWDYLYQTLPK